MVPDVRSRFFTINVWFNVMPDALLIFNVLICVENPLAGIAWAEVPLNSITPRLSVNVPALLYVPLIASVAEVVLNIPAAMERLLIVTGDDPKCSLPAPALVRLYVGAFNAPPTVRILPVVVVVTWIFAGIVIAPLLKFRSLVPVKVKFPAHVIG